ncbi:MAG: hypothetical protein QXD10_10195 [Metallosphaera sp.]
MKSTEINLWAPHLSWIANCSLTRYILLGIPWLTKLHHSTIDRKS